MKTEHPHPSNGNPWADGWDYELYMGRWSKLLAGEFLKWLTVPPGSYWLDVGCGTGALLQRILELASPQIVIGIDPWKECIEFARAYISDPRAWFIRGNGQTLSFVDKCFDAVVAGLSLDKMPDPLLAVKEWSRVTRPGGILAGYVWDFAGEMQMLRFFWDTAVEIDPPAHKWDHAQRYPLCKPELLLDLFCSAGLQKVEVCSLIIPTLFQDFEDYWVPFLRNESYLQSLEEERRTLLRNRLCSRLPIQAKGSIPLIARAWAVRGIRLA